MASIIHRARMPKSWFALHLFSFIFRNPVCLSLLYLLEWTKMLSMQKGKLQGREVLIWNRFSSRFHAGNWMYIQSISGLNYLKVRKIILGLEHSCLLVFSVHRPQMCPALETISISSDDSYKWLLLCWLRWEIQHFFS